MDIARFAGSTRKSIIIITIVVTTVVGTRIITTAITVTTDPRRAITGGMTIITHHGMPLPIIAGSVIGGGMGREISRADPRDTAVGTVIGYQIVRNRDG